MHIKHSWSWKSSFLFVFLLDVCAIVHSVGEISSIIAKATQKELIKRDVEIVDDSEMLVRLTVWGDEACSFLDLFISLYLMQKLWTF